MNLNFKIHDDDDDDDMHGQTKYYIIFMPKQDERRNRSIFCVYYVIWDSFITLCTLNNAGIWILHEAIRFCG